MYSNSRASRRQMLKSADCGFGSLALTDLLCRTSPAADANSAVAEPLAPKPPQFVAKASQVIFLFMHGGPSQIDTFDYKPLLERDHGKPLPFEKPRVFSGSTG